ncbi:hypothetical protein G8V07_16415 [Clostridium botulinum D/C]|uniref:hypothetical protein n=1 Tax=Clostridium botulinum TaxID=1491 RepID=UPI001E43B8EB|nr:hypothetical protein [Clostridium botulinum]MCD3322063.1 hypothetical protein [Clostridium botulinum D/C]MCD3325278.1 hypothetical protein [Clostridium botulinum D/C]MCD3328447.1 hypothetical protein [Clostridium botulinum D/C]
MKIEKWTSSNKKVYKLTIHRRGEDNMELAVYPISYDNTNEFFQEDSIYPDNLGKNQPLSLNCEKWIEDDGSTTLSLDNFDIVVNGDTFHEAIDLLIADLKEYIEDFCSDIGYWSKDKKRVKEIQYLTNIFNRNTDNKIRDMIQCRAGEN